MPDNLRVNLRDSAGIETGIYDGRGYHQKCGVHVTISMGKKHGDNGDRKYKKAW